MADRLSAYWKQSVYVGTRAGAAGNLAADAAAKAAGDGYTLLFAQNGSGHQRRSASQSAVPRGDRPGAARPVAATPHILIVAPDFPAKSVRELVAKAKAEPGKLSFASSGVGNSDHLCGELFNLMAGVQAIHVPYKGGAPAAVDVMGGRIAYYFAGMPVGLPLAKSGKRALAVTSKTRFAGAPIFRRWRSRGCRNTRRRYGRASSRRLPCRPISARIAGDVRKVLALRRQKTNCRARSKPFRR